ncbi:AAA family ATPase [Thaumasiovibrio subtropicus]|uniref:AAA family ATPase n=1 Tax=Thaumasiovibrio subtropicus TaxID=1891207 RepID=UPI000B353FC3|nr:hypothetical protein [Thaumasiovibrio subtropicus]
MFDLVDILNKHTVDEQQENAIKAVLFFKTEVCRSLVMEAFAFEGLGKPVILENKDIHIVEHVETQEIELVLLELNNSDSVVADAERISHIIPNHASVVVIGDEDAISTIRQLKGMGFYYLFWPISKQELIDFVKSVNENRQRQKGLGQNRKGKRVSVVGSKGGVGCSLICAEIAYGLADDKHASALLVDHHYSGGNLDIMLGKKDLAKRQLQPGTLTSKLDHNSALTLLDKVSEKIKVLSIGSKEGGHQEVRDFTDSVVELVSHDVNFIVEDVSASINFEASAAWLCERSDIIVIVMEPTVSSLRETERLLEKVNPLRHEAGHPIRLLLVVNHHRASKFETVSDKDIETYLDKKIDVTLPYEPHAGDLVLQGKRLFNGKTKMSSPLKLLVSKLVGESNSKRKGLKSLFSRR